MIERKIRNKIYQILKVFEIDNIKVEVEFDDYRKEVIYVPNEEKKAIFYLSSRDYNDIESSIYELTARLRLGVVYNPLLTTLIFENATNENEEYAIGRFYYIVSPLLDAWSYGEILKYAPEKATELFKEFVEEYQMLELKRMMGEKTIPDVDLVRINLSGHLIARLLGFPSEVVFTGDESENDIFRDYLHKLEILSESEPDINLMIELAKEYLPGFDVVVKDNVISIKESI